MPRIMLKLSGEALAGDKHTGFDEESVRVVARQVRSLYDTGAEIAVVIGGGNFWRGRTGNEIDRVKSDQIGMLATVMNCIYVSEIFKSEGMDACIMTPFACSSFTEPYSVDKARAYLTEKKIVFFAGGTGHPYFSTDTGVVLRSLEIQADMILLAKAVDGVYDADPATHPDAKRYDTISLAEVVEQGLQVMDLTASVLAKDNHLELRVFALQEENSILKAASGKFNGTVVTA